MGGKLKTSSNDSRGKHPYLQAHNWLPGGRCCFWLTGMYSTEMQEKLTQWAYDIQNKRPKENLI